MSARFWKHNKNGYFYVLWQENGKTRQKSLKTKEKALARRRFNEFKRELNAGNIKPLSGPVVAYSDFIDEFLYHCEKTKSKSSYTLYKVALEKAYKSWGNISLIEINHRLIDLFVSDMIENNLSKPTVNKNLRHLKSALNQAYRWGHIEKPLIFPKQLKEKKALRYLTLEQLKVLCSKIDDPEFYDYCLLAAFSGLRSGEILRLKESDIDNPVGFIRVSSEQKNNEESRIPITSSIREIINRVLSVNNKDKLFKYTCLTWISQKFKIYAKKAGFPHIRFHDLRHTAATHMIMSGIDLYTVQKLMRHSSPSMTQHYASLSPEYLKKESEKLDYDL